MIFPTPVVVVPPPSSSSSSSSASMASVASSSSVADRSLRLPAMGDWSAESADMIEWCFVGGSNPTSNSGSQTGTGLTPPTPPPAAAASQPPLTPSVDITTPQRLSHRLTPQSHR
jgi:hypothetical protein